MTSKITWQRVAVSAYIIWATSYVRNLRREMDKDDELMVSVNAFDKCYKKCRGPIFDTVPEGLNSQQTTDWYNRRYNTWLGCAAKCQNDHPF